MTAYEEIAADMGALAKLLAVKAMCPPCSEPGQKWRRCPKYKGRYIEWGHCELDNYANADREVIEKRAKCWIEYVAAMREYKLAQTQVEWVDVNDRLPSSPGPYLVCINVVSQQIGDCAHRTAVATYERGSWLAHGWDGRTYMVTHFAPLPQTPETGAVPE